MTPADNSRELGSQQVLAHRGDGRAWSRMVPVEKCRVDFFFRAWSRMVPADVSVI